MRDRDRDATTRVLLGMFRRDLPITVAVWVAVSAFIGIVGVVSGDQSPRDALGLGLTFLPLAVPLAPLVWLRWEPRARTRGALPVVGLGCLWSLVTLPIAIGISVLIGNLLGAE